MKKDRTENIQKTYKKCAPYRNCTEIVQKIYRKCAKICNNSNNKPVSTNELLQNLAHFLYIFCSISVQFPYGAHFLYVFCMFSVRSFFIGHLLLQFTTINLNHYFTTFYFFLQMTGCFRDFGTARWTMVVWPSEVSQEDCVATRGS